MKNDLLDFERDQMLDKVMDEICDMEEAGEHPFWRDVEIKATAH